MYQKDWLILSPIKGNVVVILRGIENKVNRDKSALSYTQLCWLHNRDRTPSRRTGTAGSTCTISSFRDSSPADGDAGPQVLLVSTQEVAAHRLETLVLAGWTE
ncbi:hypothetical protein E2C01_074464 [Portunus trituberculatus]|uniref:Uncharacterized protein n=1 Tax=Portunus trituberculatus TaxID=210409 RepID=A0A5B7IGC9_PORTR|nr:hypothetical protein [Portunus trituberculatus]